MDVSGSRVLISGGARGIGRATALAFRDASKHAVIGPSAGGSGGGAGRAA